MSAKFEYTPMSIFSVACAALVKAAAKANPSTASIADGLGIVASAVFGGIELEKDESIKEKLDQVMDEAWKDIFRKYNLTEECLSDLKLEVMGEGTPVIAFVENLQRKNLEQSLATAICNILNKHIQGLKHNSEELWNDNYTKDVSRQIADCLVDAIKSLLAKEDMLIVLKAILDGNTTLNQAIDRNKRINSSEHEFLAKSFKEYLKKSESRIISEYKKSSSDHKESPPLPETDVFCKYYEYVVNLFTSRKQSNVELMGNLSDRDAYIDLNISYENSERKDNIEPVFSFLKKWFCTDIYGTMLIYGEPGMGKTMLCGKAVYEYREGEFLKNDAKNVLAVSLNTGENKSIVKGSKVDLRRALAWGADLTDPDSDHAFSFKDCCGALLFMDGFDEFIDDARGSGINDIISLLGKIEQYAQEYQIHIVVLSRTAAVYNYLADIPNEKRCSLVSITEEQQFNWLDRQGDYVDYKETFEAVRQNENMCKLIGIPLLFRFVVHTRFANVGNNVVDLYDKLVKHLIKKRGIRDVSRVIDRLSDLAYDIYCTDTFSAVIEEEKQYDKWILVFYTWVSASSSPCKELSSSRELGKADGSKEVNWIRVGFFHSSFYQYFLARYIYTGIMRVQDELTAEEYIGKFAERELDDTVRQYLFLMLKDEDKSQVHSNLELAIRALVRTEAYLNFEPRFKSGKAEKTKIGRTKNVFRNIFHICTAFSYVIKIPFKNGLDILLRTFRGNGLVICSSQDCRANLCGANLTSSYLAEADLSSAELSLADMSGADMMETDLKYAILDGARLMRARLWRAKLLDARLVKAILVEADLREARFWKTNLENAEMSGATLSGADFSGARMNKAILSRAILSGADLTGVVDMRGVIFSRADLSGAKLSGLDLRGIDLSEATLCGADLNGADLRGANLSGANLNGADLSGADISGVDLSWADLSGVDLDTTQFSYYYREFSYDL